MIDNELQMNALAVYMEVLRRRCSVVPFWSQLSRSIFVGLDFVLGKGDLAVILVAVMERSGIVGSSCDLAGSFS